MPSPFEESADEALGRGQLNAPGRFFTPVAFGEGELVSERYRAMKNLVAEEAGISSLIARTASNKVTIASADRQMDAFSQENAALDSLNALDPMSEGFNNALSQFNQLASVSQAVSNAVEQKLNQREDYSGRLQQLTQLGVSAGLDDNQLAENNRTAKDLLRAGDLSKLNNLFGTTARQGENYQREMKFNERARASLFDHELDQNQKRVDEAQDVYQASRVKRTEIASLIPDDIVKGNPEIFGDELYRYGEREVALPPLVFGARKQGDAYLTDEQKQEIIDAGGTKADIEGVELWGRDFVAPQSEMVSDKKFLARQLAEKTFYGIGFQTVEVDNRDENGELILGEGAGKHMVTQSNLLGVDNIPADFKEKEDFTNFFHDLADRALDTPKESFVQQFTKDLQQEDLQKTLIKFLDQAGDDAAMMQILLEGNLKGTQATKRVEAILSGLWEQVRAVKDYGVEGETMGEKNQTLEQAQILREQQAQNRRRQNAEDGKEQGLLGDDEESDIPVGTDPNDPLGAYFEPANNLMGAVE